MAVTKQQIQARLQQVQDPQLHRDIVSLGWVQRVAYCDGVASIELKVPQAAAAGREQIQRDVEAAVRSLGDEIKQVAVDFTVGLGASSQPKSDQAASQAQQGEPESPQVTARANNPLPGVKHIIAVGAGKGGVGKSSVAVNLAVGLARQGAMVGLMDGDIYGPSLPTMLALDQLKPAVEDNMLVPFHVHDIYAMTIGALVEDEKPLIWRGPMAHGAFRQLATQTRWGDLDYLIIDLPPGTGDVPLTMAQLLPLTGAVVVCTPQKVAQDDARRAVHMFQQLGIELLGVVENMSYFIGDDGKEYDIFGKGGAEMMATQLGVPFLGAVPISMSLRRNSDGGNPTANFDEDSALSRDLESLVRKFAAQVKVVELSEASQQPTLSIH